MFGKLLVIFSSVRVEYYAEIDKDQKGNKSCQKKLWMSLTLRLNEVVVRGSHWHLFPNDILSKTGKKILNNREIF